MVYDFAVPQSRACVVELRRVALVLRGYEAAHEKDRLLRVSPFQRVIHSAHVLSEVNWAQLALECGYYDPGAFQS